VTGIWALEPSEAMWKLAGPAVAQARVEVEFLQSGAEEIPLPRNSIDTVVLTYTLCTIPDTAAALAEIRRVLVADGRLIFCEHGEAPDANVQRWQKRLNPVWKSFSGGCHLDRPIPALIEGAGFRIGGLETMYLPGWKPASFNFWGEARI
jgi:SAM-dependent methyltransferase